MNLNAFDSILTFLMMTLGELVNTLNSMLIYKGLSVLDFAIGSFVIHFGFKILYAWIAVPQTNDVDNKTAATFGTSTKLYVPYNQRNYSVYKARR